MGIRIKTKCKYCQKEYEVKTNETLYLECCSKECINHYYKATGTGFNLTNKEIIYDRDVRIKQLLREYKKKNET